MGIFQRGCSGSYNFHDVEKKSVLSEAPSYGSFIFNAKNMSSDQIFSHSGLNKKLAKEIPYDPKEARDAILNSAAEAKTYLKSYDMSEVLQGLVECINQ
jgi:hypothetical protein